MAKSYYKIVKGVRYDRALLEAAENRIKGQGDGRISEQDLKELVDLSEDGKGITVTELRTLRYIQYEFNLTEKAQRWLVDNVNRLEKEKISSESEDTNSLDKSTFIEEEKEGQAEMANEPHGDDKVDPNQIDHRGAELNTSEDAEETTEKETKSYYRIIAGKKYDRGLLEAADERVKGKGDGRISENDLIELVELSRDGRGITETELETLNYIKIHYNLTEKANTWLADHIKEIDAEIVGKRNSQSDSNLKAVLADEEQTDDQTENESEIDSTPSSSDQNGVNDQEEVTNSEIEDQQDSTEHEKFKPYPEIVEEKSVTPHGHNFLFHLVWGSLLFIAIGGGWFYFDEQKEIVDDLKVELSQKNDSELLKSEFEKLALEKENLESQFLTLEKAFQELERKNASGSNQNISQKTLDLENELKSVKNELSQFKQDYESLQAESLALKSTNKQLISASRENTQVVGFADGENCCFCSCKVDSLTESLNLIKINE